MVSDVETYKVLKMPERKVGNPDGLKEYCKIFPVFANIEGKCVIR